MEEKRGYLLTPASVSSSDIITPANNQKLEGVIIYNANPINQFNEFTAVAKQLQEFKTALYVSKGFMEKSGFVEADKIEIETAYCVVTLPIIIDNQLAGDVSYVPTFEKNSETKNLFGSYRFVAANLKKV